MITFNRTKKSTHRIWVGWALGFYCDSQEDIDSAIRFYGAEKIRVEELEDKPYVV